MDQSENGREAPPRGASGRSPPRGGGGRPADPVSDAPPVGGRADGAVAAAAAERSPAAAAVEAPAADGAAAAAAAARKRARVHEAFGLLEERYFRTVGGRSGEERRSSLRVFTEELGKFTQYSLLRSRATLRHGATRYGADGVGGAGAAAAAAAAVAAGGSGGIGAAAAMGMDAASSHASNIVSSIEFDVAAELVATAGMTKRIKIFNFLAVAADAAGPAASGGVHFPVRELVTREKLSCLSWNPYIRQHIASSDYDGVVSEWDVSSSTGVAVREYDEHERRAWSVDYCSANPTLLASGSDDGRVKVWSTASPSSVLTIENRANVCCVQWSPASVHELAFGSADHAVRFYDLRAPRSPLYVFSEHHKAVSFVRFMSPTELVSASTDSTLKLWSLKPGPADTAGAGPGASAKPGLVRTFRGHTNDKNFVGLSVTRDYMACGSEDNTVYTYYKALPTPFLTHRFGSTDPVTGEETEESATGQQVSSVAWSPRSPKTLLAASSQGIIKMLELE